MRDGHVTLLAVGDTGPAIEPPGKIFSLVTERLSRATWRFAQVERTFSVNGSYDPASMGYHSRRPPEMATAYRDGGFDVVSLASNHALDWGQQALLDSLDTFDRLGIRVVGAGRDKAQAHAPAVLRAGDTSVAVLAYCSVLPMQYWAEDDRPGCAPLRADSYFQAMDSQPGSPARVRSEPLAEDLERMLADVAAAKALADYVVLSFHWGVHFAPRTVADYQVTVAHAAIDAGCDAIIGHGPHLIRGVEVHRGRPILYSLGNFVMASTPGTRPRTAVAAPAGRFSFSEIYDIPVGPGLSYQHRQYQSMGLVAELDFSARSHAVSVRLTPSTTDDEHRALILPPDDPRFATTVEFLRWASEPFDAGDRLVTAGDSVELRLD